MLKELIIPTTIAAALAATPVLANQTSDTSGESKADRQSNMQDSSSVTGTGTRNQDFDQLDTDRDGSLSEDELNAWGSTAAGSDENSGAGDNNRSSDMMNRYDRDKSGSVSQDEWNQNSNRQNDQ